MYSGAVTKALEETIAFAERRHSVLAGNLANMDTPDYKARDLNVDAFQKSLKELITRAKNNAGRSQGDVSARSPGGLLSPGTLQGNGAGGSLASEQTVDDVRDVSTQIVYHDGSNDNLETQITEIAKNQAMHSTAIALLKSQFRTLQMAISGNVGA